MKKVFIFAVLAMTAIVASAQSYMLAIAFSNNTAEDDNVKLEFYGRSLVITNKTDKPLYIDRKATSISECGYVDNLSESKTTIEAPITVSPKSKMKLSTVLNYFGNRNFDVSKGVSYLKYKRLWDGKAESDKATPREISKLDKKFLNAVDKLYNQLGEKQEKTASAAHYTEDESFLTMNAYVNYSSQQNMSNPQSIQISSWASDAILCYSYMQYAKKEKKSGLAMDEDDVSGHKLYLFANSPFDTNDESTPITVFSVKLDKIKKGILEMDDPIQGALGNLLNPARAAVKGFFNPFGAMKDLKKLKSITNVGLNYHMFWEHPYDLNNKEEKKAFHKRIEELSK